MISIVCDAAVFAGIHAHRERHLLSVATVGAGLRCVSGRHFDHCSASFFHFVEQCSEKCAPCRVCNRCVESGLPARAVRQKAPRFLIQSGPGAFGHVTDRQSFNCDQSEAIHDAARLLLDKVLSPPSDPLMNPRHHPTLFGSRLRSFLRSREPARGFGKVFRISAEKAWILDLLPIGEVGKGLESHVDPYLILRWGQNVWHYLIAGERCIPFSCGGPGDATGLHNALVRAVLHQLEVPDFRKRQFALFIETKTGLRVSQALVAKHAFIAWIARRQSSFYTVKESLECFVDTAQDVLQDLRVDGGVFWSERFDFVQLGSLLGIDDAFTAHPLRFPALLKSDIIQLRAQGKLFIQQACLLLRWVDPVLIGFPHTFQYFSNGEKRKVPSFLLPSRNAAYFPSKSLQESSLQKGIQPVWTKAV